MNNKWNIESVEIQDANGRKMVVSNITAKKFGLYNGKVINGSRMIDEICVFELGVREVLSEYVVEWYKVKYKMPWYIIVISSWGALDIIIELSKFFKSLL